VATIIQAMSALLYLPSPLKAGKDGIKMATIANAARIRKGAA
jgi:hypothetical protein